MALEQWGRSKEALKSSSEITVAEAGVVQVLLYGAGRRDRVDLKVDWRVDGEEALESGSDASGHLIPSPCPAPPALSLPSHFHPASHFQQPISQSLTRVSRVSATIPQMPSCSDYSIIYSHSISFPFHSHLVPISFQFDSDFIPISFRFDFIGFDSDFI